MNGAHDLGGTPGLGPVPREKNEPVFHARWEARIFALNLAMRAWGKWNIDAGRHAIELLPPAEYLRMSYYERWAARLAGLLVKTGLVTGEELETGRPAQGSQKLTPPLTAENVPAALAAGAPASRDVPVTPRFSAGQRVRTRDLHRVGHTRLPRYARSKLGLIEKDHGVYVFPDTNAHFLGEKPQHLYSVRFAAPELWGAGAPPHDAVYLDLWDDNLEPA